MAWLTVLNLGDRSLLDRWVGFRRWLRRQYPPVWMGTLRRTTPLSNGWGYERGRPVDRYYIDGFSRGTGSIHGRVLEILNSITRSDMAPE
jgi:hypothetical protein